MWPIIIGFIGLKLQTLFCSIVCDAGPTLAKPRQIGWTPDFSGHRASGQKIVKIIYDLALLAVYLITTQPTKNDERVELAC